ncbi:MAG: MBL fold metallo-hydrolase [Dehalococcoidales bacterium]|nr:MBL fold metallo-hydrolase [Dehalococcoidales bacterium]
MVEFWRGHDITRFPSHLVTQIAEGIYSVGPISTSRTQAGGQSISPFLVVGERAAIVEPGDDLQAPKFLEDVRYLDAIDLDHIDYIIPSHIHMHHVAAMNVLQQEITHAKLVVHQRGVQHMIDPTKLNEATVKQSGEGRCAVLEAVPEDRIMAVAGGEVLDLGGRQLEIIEAVGHAPHDICIFDRLTRALWIGDCLSLNHRIKRASAVMNVPGFDVEQTVAFLHRLRALNPDMLLVWDGITAYYQADELLRTAEEEVLAIEQIVLEGMKQKLMDGKIGEKVLEYRLKVGLGPGGRPGAEPEPPKGPPALYRYLQKKHPELEIPQGVR